MELCRTSRAKSSQPCPVVWCDACEVDHVLPRTRETCQKTCRLRNCWTGCGKDAVWHAEGHPEKHDKRALVIHLVQRLSCFWLFGISPLATVLDRIGCGCSCVCR